MNNTEYIFKFGKHKGQPISTIPKDYLRWLLNKPDTVIGLKKIIGKYLGIAKPNNPLPANEGLTDDMKIEIYSLVSDLVRLELEKMKSKGAIE